MVTGQGASLQIGQETTWGTKANPTSAINFTSEGFKLVVDRTEEDSLVGHATSQSMDIQKKSVTFSWEQLAKPENIGLVLGLAMGVEATPEKTGEVYAHSFTLLPPGINNSLPKFSATVDRHVATKAYTGCKIGTLNISCSAGDYMRISVSGVGKDEVAGTKSNALSIPTIKAFRFAGGHVTFDGTENGDITGFELGIENNLDDGEQTTGSGYYGTENEPQKRAVTISLDSFYNSNTETVRNSYYKTESEAAVVLKFVSPDEISTGNNYEIQITLPHVTITECDPNVAGNEKIKLSISGTACQTSTDEAITIVLKDKKSTKYLA